MSQPPQSQQVRPPAVAGLFYPAEPARLRADVEAMLEAARPAAGDGAPAPYGQPAHQPGAYQPGTNTAASGYGTVPPATGYGAPS